MRERICSPNWCYLSQPPVGMKYDAIARVTGGGHSSYCSNTTSGTPNIPSIRETRSIGFIISARTNYDQTKGNAASGFPLRGDGPGPYVEKVISAAVAKSTTILSNAHIKDYQILAGAFSLELLDPSNSAGVETSILIKQCTSNDTGDPFLEPLLSNYSRHLFISPLRDNSPPPNLQCR